MRADAEMMGLLLYFFENLKIWRQMLLSGSPGNTALCCMGGAGAGIFLGQDFLKFSWNDLIPVLQTKVTKHLE